MDADYDPTQQTVSKKKKKKERKTMKKEDLPQMGKKRKKSHFAEVVTKNKPVFDPRKCQKTSCHKNNRSVPNCVLPSVHVGAVHLSCAALISTG